VLGPGGEEGPVPVGADPDRHRARRGRPVAELTLAVVAPRPQRPVGLQRQRVAAPRGDRGEPLADRDQRQPAGGRPVAELAGGRCGPRSRPTGTCPRRERPSRPRSRRRRRSFASGSPHRGPPGPERAAWSWCRRRAGRTCSGPTTRACRRSGCRA
jgi:hypothetical protein